MLRLTSGTPRAAPHLSPGASRSAVPAPLQVPSCCGPRPGDPAFSWAWRELWCRLLLSQSDGGRDAGSLVISPGWLRFLRNGRCASMGLRKRRPSEDSSRVLAPLSAGHGPWRPFSSPAAGRRRTRTLAAKSCAEPRGEIVLGGQ